MNTATDTFADLANTATTAANTAFTNTTNAIQNAAKVANQAVSGAVSSAVNAANQAVNGAVNVANQAVNAVNQAAAPVINSVLPFGNTNRKNANFNTAASAAPSNNKKNNTGNAFSFAAANTSANAVAANSGKGGMNWPLVIFVILITGFVTLFVVFNRQILLAYDTLAASIKGALGLSSVPPVQAQIVPIRGDVVTVPPEAPQDVVPDEAARKETLVEKILPTGASNEVFNVSQNRFTYYDAEPLCRALGAELATYEQVKDAWGKGADWCNYGWVKGQMAVYPTQEDTYEKLQTGTPEERQACGTVGINGGFFDNPELRYGVNCYGKKPPQSAHDETKLMEQGKVPRSAAALTVDKLAAEFRNQKDSMFIRPFNDNKWYSA